MKRLTFAPLGGLALAAALAFAQPQPAAAQGNGNSGNNNSNNSGNSNSNNNSNNVPGNAGVANTPELGSVALFGSGALGLAGYAWNRARRRGDLAHTIGPIADGQAPTRG